MFRGSTVTVPVLSCPKGKGQGQLSRRGTRSSTGGATPPRLVIAPGRVERRRTPASLRPGHPHHGGRCPFSSALRSTSPLDAAGCPIGALGRSVLVRTKGQHLDLGSTGQRIDDDRTGPADGRPDIWFALASFVRSRRGRRRVTFATCADGRRASGRRGRRDAGSCGACHLRCTLRHRVRSGPCPSRLL